MIEGQAEVTLIAINEYQAMLKKNKKIEKWPELQTIKVRVL